MPTTEYNPVGRPFEWAEPDHSPYYKLVETDQRTFNSCPAIDTPPPADVTGDKIPDFIDVYCNKGGDNDPEHALYYCEIRAVPGRYNGSGALVKDGSKFAERLYSRFMWVESNALSLAMGAAGINNVKVYHANGDKCLDISFWEYTGSNTSKGGRFAQKLLIKKCRKADVSFVNLQPNP